MNLPAAILATGGSFLFLCLVFHPLERVFPAKRGQRFLRPEWWIDLCFFLGQYLLWSGLVLWLLTHFANWIDGGIPTGFRAAVAGQPWWLQAVEVISAIFSSIGATACSTEFHFSGGSIPSTTAPSISTGWPHTASIRWTRFTRWA
jgi:hypothetical protein